MHPDPGLHAGGDPVLTIEEQEAESAIRQMLDNFSYGVSLKTMAVLLRVMAEHLSKCHLMK